MNVRAAERPSNPIRTLRERRGLTREQAAVKAGVSSSTLYLAERAGLLSDATAAKLARVLACDVEDLLAARPAARAAP